MDSGRKVHSVCRAFSLVCSAHWRVKCEVMKGVREGKTTEKQDGVGARKAGGGQMRRFYEQVLLYLLGSLPILGHRSFRAVVCKLYCLLESRREIKRIQKPRPYTIEPMRMRLGHLYFYIICVCFQTKTVSQSVVLGSAALVSVRNLLDLNSDLLNSKL